MQSWELYGDIIRTVLQAAVPAIITYWVMRRKHKAETGATNADAAESWSNVAERAWTRAEKLEKERDHFKAKWEQAKAKQGRKGRKRS